MLNPNWSRWVFASVTRHFANACSPLPFFIEGQSRDNIVGQLDFIEIRVDGPYFRELSHNVWKVRTEVNVLIQSAMRDTDFHAIHRIAGTVAAAFTPIPIYKYGTGDDDNGSLLGCLKLVTEARDRDAIKINHFGQINNSVRNMQATVEGHYDVILEI